jgi:hypothetical protein
MNPAQAAMPTDSVELPLELNRGVGIVTIDGFRLAVDTGSSVTLMRSSALIAILKREKTPLFLSGICLDYAIGVDDRLFPPGFRDMRLDGTIGLDALVQSTFGFDYQSRRLTLWPPAVAPEEETSWVCNGRPKTSAVRIDTHLMDLGAACWLPRSPGERPLMYDSGADICDLGSPPPGLSLPTSFLRAVPS